MAKTGETKGCDSGNVCVVEAAGKRRRKGLKLEERQPRGDGIEEGGIDWRQRSGGLRGGGRRGEGGIRI